MLQVGLTPTSEQPLISPVRCDRETGVQRSVLGASRRPGLSVSSGTGITGWKKAIPASAKCDSASRPSRMTNETA